MANSDWKIELGLSHIHHISWYDKNSLIRQYKKYFQFFFFNFESIIHQNYFCLNQQD